MYLKSESDGGLPRVDPLRQELFLEALEEVLHRVELRGVSSVEEEMYFVALSNL